MSATVSITTEQINDVPFLLGVVDDMGIGPAVDAQLACQVVPGNAADDGLYGPAYDAAVRTLGTAAVLIVGDSKMADRATQEHILSLLALPRDLYARLAAPSPNRSSIARMISLCASICVYSRLCKPYL